MEVKFRRSLSCLFRFIWELHACLSCEVGDLWINSHKRQGRTDRQTRGRRVRMAREPYTQSHELQ